MAQTDCTIELRLTSGPGHYVLLRAALAEHGGWDVSIRRDGCLVERKHCGDWHRVERLRAHAETERTSGGQLVQLPDSPTA